MEAEQLTYQERADRLRRIAGRLPRWCWDVADNLFRDADELDRGIWPGSEQSWRTEWARLGLPILGG